MPSLHRIELIGHAGHDPSMRFTPSGQPVTQFPLATSEQYTNQAGEQVKRTVWFRVSVWGKMAEVCKEHVYKGMLVYIEGRLTADEKGNPKTYKNKQGEPTANFDVTATSIKFLSKRGEPASQPEAIPDSDLPF